MRLSFSFIITIVSATFLMGSAFVVGKILLKTYNMTPFNLVGWRFLCAAIASLPIIFLNKSSFSEIKKSDWLKISVIGLLQTGLTMGFLFLSMLYVTASSAAALLFTNPLIVAVVTIYLSKASLEAKTYFKILGFIVGCLGVWLIVGADTNLKEWRGILLGLASGISFAASIIYSKKVELKVSPIIVSAAQMLVGSIFLLICAFLFEGNTFKIIDNTQLFYFLWLAIPASTGSFALWAIALNKSDATTASSFLFLGPLFTIIISHFFLHSEFSIIQVLGAALIGFSLFVINKIIGFDKKNVRHS